MTSITLQYESSKLVINVKGFQSLASYNKELQNEFKYSAEYLQFECNRKPIQPRRPLFMQIQESPATILCNNIVSSTRVCYQGKEDSVTVRLGDTYYSIVANAIKILAPSEIRKSQRWSIYNRNTNMYVDRNAYIVNPFTKNDVFDLFATPILPPVKSSTCSKRPNHSRKVQSQSQTQTQTRTHIQITEHELFLSLTGHKVNPHTYSGTHYLVKYIAPQGPFFDVSSFYCPMSFQIEQYTNWVLETPIVSDSIAFISSFYLSGYRYITSTSFFDTIKVASMRLRAVEGVNSYLVVDSLCLPCSDKEKQFDIIQLLRFLVNANFWELRYVSVSLRSYSEELFESMLPLLKQLSFAGVSSIVCGTSYAFHPFDSADPASNV